MNIAVFIDFDNIEIGVKTTLGEHFDVSCILEAIKERGEVVSKIAYADWTRAGEYSRHLTQHAIRLVQRNLTPGGDKNGGDINLALDALEMAFTHQHINAYVIVGGDSDFLSLVEKLKQYDKKVFVVGGRAFTSIILQRNCHEFIAYENLTGSRRSVTKGAPAPRVTSSAPVAQAIPIVRRALKILADREVSPQTGLLKSTLLQLDSTFSERNYGASSFLDFVEKLSQAGVVTLKHAGRSVMVELTEAHDDASATRAAGSDGGSEQGTLPAAGAQAAAQAAQPFRPAADSADTPQAGTPADGVARASGILAAATTARWPMYLRNVKQILRQHRGGGAPESSDGVFDERRYGFGGLMDLLKALQREGFVRIERDRRGGLRVFQGAKLQGAGARAAMAGLPQVDEVETVEAEVIEAPSAGDASDEVPVELVAEPIPVDTTAELLGRAKPKRPARGRTSRVPAAAAAASGPRKSAAKRPAARRPRSRKAAPPQTDHNEG